MASGISPGGRPIDESPLSKSKTDNWVARAGGLPPYVRGVARGIAKNHGGAVTSKDIQIAIGKIEDWAKGGDSVSPAVRAAAAKALAQWQAARAKSHITTSLAYDRMIHDIELDWSKFDAARGTHPRQPKAAPVAPPAGAKAEGTTNQPLNQAASQNVDMTGLSQAAIENIKTFQKDRGLPVTGVLDQNTVQQAQQYPAQVQAAAAAKKAKAASDKAARASASAQKKAAAAAAKTQRQQVAAQKKAAAASAKAQRTQAAAQKKAAQVQAAAARKKVQEQKATARATAAAQRKAATEKRQAASKQKSDARAKATAQKKAQSEVTAKQKAVVTAKKKAIKTQIGNLNVAYAKASVAKDKTSQGKLRIQIAQLRATYGNL